MAKVYNQINGAGELAKILGDFEKKLQTKVLRKAMRDGAKEFLKEVKARTPVDTGFLKKNSKIKAAKRKKNFIGFQIVIGSGGDKREYIAAFIEYGTFKFPARPFIRPAFDAVKDRVASEATEFIKQGIEAMAGPKRVR